MYACLYTPALPAEHALSSIALQFSPEIEEVSPQAVVFSIAGLSRLLGSALQIAAAIRQTAERAGFVVQLSIASNPDSAILLAHHCPEAITLTPEEERARLAALPITALFTKNFPAEVNFLALLQSWGVQTCGELAALPERGIAERWGRHGIDLQRLAQGRRNRPLRILPQPARYEEHIMLEHPVEQQEALLFLISRVLQELCRRLQAQSQAARGVKIEFALETEPHLCEVEFAVPLTESPSILKLLQLHLERHGPPSAVLAFTLSLIPASARRLQNSLFEPATPPADKLQVTLARITGWIGPESVGCPQLLDTHRPDAFCLLPFPAQANTNAKDQHQPEAKFRLALRRFRPPLTAQVQMRGGKPHFVRALSVGGKVRRCSGVWRTAGEWWAATAWSREEWDVELEDGSLYRLSRERATWQWYVEGIYD